MFGGKREREREREREKEKKRLNSLFIRKSVKCEITVTRTSRQIYGMLLLQHEAGKQNYYIVI